MAVQVSRSFSDNTDLMTTYLFPFSRSICLRVQPEYLVHRQGQDNRLVVAVRAGLVNRRGIVGRIHDSVQVGHEL